MNIPFFKPKQRSKVDRTIRNSEVRSQDHVRGQKQTWMFVNSAKKKQSNARSQIEDIVKEREKRKLLSSLNLSNVEKPKFEFRLPQFNVAYLIPVVLILVLGGFGYFLHKQEVLIIKQIEIEGNEEISDLQIVGVIGDLEGKSMILTAGADLERSLTDSFPYIRRVYVDKILPSKLKIRVEERFPKFAYANLSAAYLVDEENVVVEVLGLDPRNELFEHEKLVLDGYGDPDADYVFAEYISDISDDEELEELDWEKVPDEEKQEALQRLRRQLRQQIETTMNEKQTFIARSGFGELLTVYGYDARTYNIGEHFNPEINKYSEQISAFLSREKIPLRKIIWKSGFTIEVGILAKTELLFTTTRDLDEQLGTFQALRSSSRIKQANSIDLRSEIIAVK